MIIGIQGGHGSNNEAACVKFCERGGIKDFEIKYLISTERVLRELNEGEIDLGVFAVKSRKGLVRETQEAMEKYDFLKVDEIDLEIKHVLLGIKELGDGEFNRVVSHAQALEEARDYIEETYSITNFCEDEDTSLAAKKLKEGFYDDKTLIIAPRSCAEIYGLKLIDDNLATNGSYLTRFYLVKRAF